VAIGGVGGSGTRVLAEILRCVGYRIGDDLNPSLDNLWFTLLFRRPGWYEREMASGGGEIGAAIEILRQAMEHRLTPTEEQKRLIERARQDASDDVGPDWARLRAASLLGSGAARRGDGPWGWKEPNTHIFLDHLGRAFGLDFRYLHVIRHGLDMAWSSNQWQVLNWGGLFQVDRGDGAPDPSRSLDFWIRANRRALEIGESIGTERFMVIRLEDLCGHPKEQIGQLFDFLALSPDPETRHRCENVPVLPASIGRFRRHPLDIFSPAQLDAVSSMGYEIPR
jgi:hypothetical protein